MAAPDDSAVDEQQEPTNVERLARFIHDHADVNELWGQPTLAEFEPLAERILTEFFRVDIDAQHIFATPGVDARSLDPFAMVMWGPMAGRLSPLELRSIGAAFLETAETAEIESTFVRWLMREDGSNIEGSIRILQSFRQFRTTLDAPAGS